MTNPVASRHGIKSLSGGDLVTDKTQKTNNNQIQNINDQKLSVDGLLYYGWGFKIVGATGPVAPTDVHGI